MYPKAGQLQLPKSYSAYKRVTELIPNFVRLQAERFGSSLYGLTSGPSMLSAWQCREIPTDCSESFPFQTDCFAIYNLLSTHHRTDRQRAPWGMISRALDHTRTANCTSSANQRRTDVKKKGKDKFTKEQEIRLPKHYICVKSFCLDWLLSKCYEHRTWKDLFWSLPSVGVTFPALLYTHEVKSVFTYPCSFLLGVSILLPGTSFKTVGWSKSNLFFL